MTNTLGAAVAPAPAAEAWPEAALEAAQGAWDYRMATATVARQHALADEIAPRGSRTARLLLEYEMGVNALRDDEEDERLRVIGHALVRAGHPEAWRFVYSAWLGDAFGYTEGEEEDFRLRRGFWAGRP